MLFFFNEKYFQEDHSNTSSVLLKISLVDSSVHVFFKMTHLQNAQFHIYSDGNLTTFSVASIMFTILKFSKNFDLFFFSSSLTSTWLITSCSILLVWIWYRVIYSVLLLLCFFLLFVDLRFENETLWDYLEINAISSFIFSPTFCFILLI